MKKSENKFYVIGGQYEFCEYGGAPTIIGAKRLASKNEELWDNWQGFHKPKIYRAEDTEVITAKGWISVRDGAEIRVPKWDAIPYNYETKDFVYWSKEVQK